MSFHGFAQMSVQNAYEVRRTGLNRLSIIIDGDDEPVSNPRLLLCGDDVVLIRDDSVSIVLPEFPQEYIPEILQGRTVLIGERDSAGMAGDMSMIFPKLHTPVRRFYEAVVCVKREDIKVQKAENVIPAAANA
jgi:hypothetical protein